MFKVCLFFLLSIYGVETFACKASTPNYSNLAISLDQERLFSYGLKVVDEKMPTSVISSCRETAAKRRFVMMTFGPEVVGLDDSIRGTNFDREFSSNESCSISSNPLSVIQSEQKKEEIFNSRWKFINECVEVTVVDTVSPFLDFPVDQTGCTVERLSNQSAKFNGGFCFFKPRADSEYNISVNVKDSCKTRKGYKDYKINLQDFEAGINLYTSGSYKGDIDDLSSIGSTVTRISVNPSKELFRVSEDFGILRPAFPADYAINDIHFGKISIFNKGSDYVQIKTPLIVNNICKSVEVNGLKSSICDYATPFVGELKLSNSKGQVQAEWFDGGVASSQWQGIINGSGFVLPKTAFKTKGTYKLEMNFSDPYFEFNSFKKLLKSRLINFNLKIPSLDTGSDITGIPDLGSFAETDPMVEVGSIGDIYFPATINGIGSERKRLNAYFSTTLFPPMYEKACAPDSGACETLGHSFVKLIATFTVNDDYSISDLLVERVSKLLGSYKKKITEQPEYICN